MSISDRYDEAFDPGFEAPEWPVEPKRKKPEKEQEEASREAEK